MLGNLTHDKQVFVFLASAVVLCYRAQCVCRCSRNAKEDDLTVELGKLTVMAMAYDL